MTENSAGLASGYNNETPNPVPSRAGWLKVVGVAAATVVAVGAGAWGGMRFFGGDNPAESPDPSSSPTVLASPTSASTGQGEVWGDVTGLVAPGEVTNKDRLPDALPLPEGLLGDTERGWVLATYLPTYSEETEAGYTETSEVQVLYLISPDGERYQVLELDHRRPMEILRWNAGESYAIVRDASEVWIADDVEEPAGSWFSLDLETGRVEPHSPSVPADARRAGTTAAGFSLWSTFFFHTGGGSDSIYVTDAEGTLLSTIVPTGRLTLREDEKATGSVDPSGTRLAWAVERNLVVARLEDGAMETVAMDVPPVKSCEFSTWLDESRALVFCMVPDDTYELDFNDREAAYYEVNASTGTSIERAGPVGGSRYFEGFLVGTAPVGQLDDNAPSGAPGDSTGFYGFNGIDLIPIEELQGFTAFEGQFGTSTQYFSRDEVLGEVLYGRFGGVSNEGGSSTLIRWDSSSHEVTVLIPGQGPYVEGDPWVYLDILSVAVAQ